MKLNNITKIDEKKGDYLILDDYRTEGLSVSSQHKTLECAIKGLGESGNPQAVVKLVEFYISSSD